MLAKMFSVDCLKITDWESFHDEFAATFGFPYFYGRNMNAWIDCMTSLDQPEDGMTCIHAARGQTLTLQLDNVVPFRESHPDLYAAIIECAAFVNWRRLEVGEPSVLSISFSSSGERRKS
ncbi:MAG: barstar family protein [Terracidiphilus sp.]